MGTNLKVEGTNKSFELNDHEITGYNFNYTVPNSKYAKGYKKEQYLQVTGNISRIIEKNEPILNNIRNWSDIEYRGEDYYSKITVTQTYMDEIMRRIIFTYGYIKDYKEFIDVHTGDGTFEIIFMQKEDKLDEITVEPKSEEFCIKHIDSNQQSNLNLVNSDKFILSNISVVLKDDYKNGKAEKNVTYYKVIENEIYKGENGKFETITYNMYGIIDLASAAWGQSPNNSSYTYINEIHNNINLHIIKTHADNIGFKALNFKGDIDQSGEYGINGGFFNPPTKGGGTLNIAVKNGLPVISRDGNGGMGNYMAGENGTGTLVYTGNTIKCFVVHEEWDIYNYVGSYIWAQGGVSMSLNDDNNWKEALKKKVMEAI